MDPDEQLRPVDADVASDFFMNKYSGPHIMPAINEAGEKIYIKTPVFVDPETWKGGPLELVELTMIPNPEFRRIQQAIMAARQQGDWKAATEFCDYLSKIFDFNAGAHLLRGNVYLDYHTVQKAGQPNWKQNGTACIQALLTAQESFERALTRSLANPTYSDFARVGVTAGLKEAQCCAVRGSPDSVQGIKFLLMDVRRQCKLPGVRCITDEELKQLDLLHEEAQKEKMARDARLAEHNLQTQAAAAAKAAQPGCCVVS